jgi:hypothetical protein
MSRSSSKIILGSLLVLVLTAVAFLLWGYSYFTINHRNSTYVTPVMLMPKSDSTLAVTVTPAPTATASSTATLAADPRSTQLTQPTPIPVNRPTDTAVTTVCINSAALIADVTIPDGSQVAPGAGFNKIWRILNTGSCTWENNYKIVHVGGPLLWAMTAEFPLNATVYPGQFHDLIISMVSPELLGTYQSDWKLQNAQGQPFGVGRNNSPFWVRIVVADTPDTRISGLIYQDVNENGTYELGEPLVAGREIRLVPSTACHTDSPIVATALSDADGRYTLSGKFSGSFCIGLVGEIGFDDGVNATLTEGQILIQVNLRAPNPSASISGYLWNDTCLTDENGAAIEGVCVPDGLGGFHADGVIQGTETYIPDVTVYLQPGTCLNNDHLPIPTSTDAAGQYVFTKLDPGTYCLSIQATRGGNGVILLSGNWTFPGWGIWYQEINLQAKETLSSVNFGWDYQP